MSQRNRTRTITVRPEPRISVNKLGEYLVAGASRRRQILRDQKRPPEFKVVRYADAQRAIVDHLVNGHSDPDVLARHLSRLANWTRGPDDSDYEVQRNQACRDAIGAFAKLADQLGFDGLTMRPGRADSPRLTKSGVQISVRPELQVHGVGRKGDRFVGALKLHVSKTFSLGEKAGEYVATMVHEFAEAHLAGDACCDYRHCYVLDVFAGILFVAPKCFTRRRSDVEAACEEIAILWKSV